MPFRDGAAYVICLVSSTTFFLDVHLSQRWSSPAIWDRAGRLLVFNAPRVCVCVFVGCGNMWLEMSWKTRDFAMAISAESTRTSKILNPSCRKWSWGCG
jgi:hypothetical protein